MAQRQLPMPIHGVAHPAMAVAEVSPAGGQGSVALPWTRVAVLGIDPGHPRSIPQRPVRIIVIFCCLPVGWSSHLDELRQWTSQGETNASFIQICRIR
jgi:hypothetical protein